MMVVQMTSEYIKENFPEILIQGDGNLYWGGMYLAWEGFKI